MMPETGLELELPRTISRAGVKPGGEDRLADECVAKA